MQDSDAVEPLSVGQRLVLSGLNTEISVAAECSSVTCRNWSRVGTCTVVTDDGPESLFVKQFIDSRDQPHADQYFDELRSIEEAAKLFEPEIEVLRPVYRNDEHLLIVFENRNMQTLDEVLRSAGTQLECTYAFEFVLNAAREILDKLEGHELEALACDGRRTCPVFRGLDARNIGVPTLLNPESSGERPYLFDLGVYRSGRRQESAARLFVAFALLNWGKPLGRFVMGPDLQQLQQVCDRLACHLDKKVTMRRLLREFRTRIVDVQGHSWSNRQAKRLGLLCVGSWYIWSVQRFVEKSNIRTLS